MIPLGEVIPVLRELRGRMRASEIHSEDLPLANPHLLCGVSDDAPLVARVERLSERHGLERRPR
jgi:hypothetical protein